MILCFLGLFLGGEVQASEAASWNEAAVEFRLADAWEVEVAQQFRVESTAKVGPALLTDIGATWRASNRFRLGVGYRIGVEDIGSGPDPTHRVHVQGELRNKIKWFRLDVRERIQARLPGFKDDAKFTSRTKIRGRFDVFLKPSIFTEVFVPLSTTVDVSKMRLGTEVRLPIKAVDIDLGYMFVFPFDDDPQMHVVQLGVGFDLDFRS